MIKKLIKIKDYFPFLLIVFFATCLAFERSFSAFTIEGIKMYFLTLFPSLFPYLFVTAMLSFVKGGDIISKFISPFFSRVFKVNGACGYAYFISLISGYPVGAITVSRLKKNNQISEAEAVRASILCSTSSPSFIITVVGAICFNSTMVGLFLFLAHFLSSITVGLIFSRYKKDIPPTPLTFDEKITTDNFIYDGIISTVNSALFVGGLVTLFYVFTEILYTLGILSLPINLLSCLIADKELSKAIVFGLFETTKGIKLLSLIKPSSLTFCVCSFLCGFSGLSVILQSVCYLKTAKIKTAPYLLSKIFSAVLNLFYSFIFSLLLF